MSYDRCIYCGHMWHGLPCIERNENFDEKLARFNSYMCMCKTSFEEPLDDTELVVLD